jgi:hypothetical protein
VFVSGRFVPIVTIGLWLGLAATQGGGVCLGIFCGSVPSKFPTCKLRLILAHLDPSLYDCLRYGRCVGGR